MSNSKITMPEAISLILSVFIAHSIISMPEEILSVTKSATIINLIYVGIIALLISLLICKLIKNFPSSDILDISEYLGGKVFKTIIGFIFIFYFIFSSSILIRNFSEGLKEVFYPMTNIIFIILAFTITCCITSRFEFSTNIKVNLILIPIILFSILFLFIANTKHFSVNRIFPILGDGIYNTFITGLGNLGAFGGIVILYFLPPYLKEPEKFKKITIMSILVAIIYLIVCVGTLLLMFSFLHSIDQILPLYSATRYIEFGTFLQRLEAVFLLIWVLEIACYLSIFTKLSALTLKKICNCNDSKPFSYILSLLVFGVAVIPPNYAVARYLESNVYKYLVFGIVFFLGISILLLANIKKRRTLNVKNK